jgi:cell division protein FtsQ
LKKVVHKNKSFKFRGLLKKLFLGVTCTFLFFTVGYSFFWCFDPFNFPVSAVHVIGERKHLSQDNISKLLSSEVKAGFFRVEVLTLQQQLLSLPWMKQVDIRKVWPNTLEIHFEEHTPAALWGDKGVLSVTGILFHPSHRKDLPGNLPVLQGPEDRHSLVWKQFLAIDAMLAPLNLKITQLILAPRGAWRMKLSNGITVVLGTNDIMTRLSHFVGAYKKDLYARKQDMVYVDLRYTSGMTIGWK